MKNENHSKFENKNTRLNQIEKSLKNNIRQEHVNESTVSIKDSTKRKIKYLKLKRNNLKRSQQIITLFLTESPIQCKE